MLDQNLDRLSQTVNGMFSKQTGWVGLVPMSGFANFGGGFAVCAYRVAADGKVIVKGLVATTSGTPTNIVQLPVALAPSENLRRATSGNSSGSDAFAALTITTAGIVMATTAATWANLSIDCEFYPAGA